MRFFEALPRSKNLTVKSYMQNFKIRTVKLEDLSKISEVNESAFGSPSYPYSLRQNFDLFSETYFVGILDGKLIGYCLGALQPLTNTGWVLDFGIMQENRGHGLGMEIFRKTCDRMVELGTQQIFLTVTTSKTGLIEKFKKNNFEEYGYEEDYFGIGLHRLIMKNAFNKSILPSADRAGKF
jgi:ribosomal protein S18 acetylase RimI-like enzyme